MSTGSVSHVRGGSARKRLGAHHAHHSDDWYSSSVRSAGAAGAPGCSALSRSSSSASRSMSSILPAGISESTARRRLADRDFRAKLDEARRELVVGVVARLAGAAERAIDVQLELLESSDTPPAVRRQVARDVLSTLDELGASRDLEGRLEALEAALGDDGSQLRVA